MKRKSLITSILVIVLCLALISGSTYSLFTSESSVNIAVTSGKVDVSADVTDLKVYSATADTNAQLITTDLAGEIQTGPFAGKYYYQGPFTSNTFANGGKATWATDTKVLTIEKITPGDKVTLNVSVTNNSNVKAKYRVRVNALESINAVESLKLFEGLAVSVGGTALEGVIRVSPWTQLDVNAVIPPIPVEIVLPLEAGNEYQNLKTEIQITVEAVQDNAATNAEIKMINEYLASQTSKNNTMYDAINSLVGASIPGLETLATYDEAYAKVENYLWNVDTDQFYTEEEVEGFAYKYFKVYKEKPTTQTYSIYAGSEWTATTVPGLTVGFDAGVTSGITSITYDRSAATYGQEVVIRTNSSTTALTVNAPKDVIRHYGTVGSLNIIAAANSSYHEYGKVTFVEISKGRFAIEANAEVSQLHISSIKDPNNNNQTTNEFDSIIISIADNTAKPIFSRDDVEIAQTGTLVVAIQEGTSKVTEETPLDYVWLTKQGIFEQIKVSESDTEITSNAQWADELGSEKEKTQEAAFEIANNIGRNTQNKVEDLVTLNNTDTYTVTLDETTRELVVKDNNNAVVTETTIKEDVVSKAVEETGLSETEKESAQSTATMFEGGNGTETNPYLISNADQWNNFYQIVYDSNLAGKTPYFELVNDINLDDVEIKNYAVNSESEEVYDHQMNFVLDGKNHSVLKIETLKGYCQVFPYVKNTTVKNITINFNLDDTRTAAMSYSSYGNVYFTNVTTTGTISTTANWATAYVAYSREGNIYYTNCTNMANIKGSFGNNGYTAVFGSHNGGGVHITFDNCKNYGGLVGGYVGFVGMGNDSAYTFVDTNAVQNYGSLKGTKNAGYFKYDSTAETKTIGGITCEVKKDGSSATKSTTHTDSAPSSFGDSIVINEVAGASKYEIELSVSIQVYNYDNGQNANRWSGGFPRSIKRSYTSEDVKDGTITTEFRKGYFGEIEADQYYGYGSTTPTYEGVFLPESFDITKANVVLKNQELYLIKENEKYFYVMYSEEWPGWYVLLTTNTSGELTTSSVSVNFSVTAYNLDGSVLSFSSFSYGSPVSEAQSFFNELS